MLLRAHKRFYPRFSRIVPPGSCKGSKPFPDEERNDEVAYTAGNDFHS